MNPARRQRLQQMGLGPVWKLRAENAAVAVHEPAAAEPAIVRLHGQDNAQDDPHTIALPDADPAFRDDLHDLPHQAPPAGAAADLAFGTAATDPATASIERMDWETLEATIRSCTRCGLCAGRTHAVPGIGDRSARWLFVGEGPGRNEDLQGEPFVGPAGKLLDNMLRALGLARGQNTYIANIVKCRPVGADGRDRPPAADEAAACLPYLRRQIALIRPDVIVALGKTAAVSLLGLTDDVSLGSLRGPARDYAGIPLVVTYHPAYLLRKPVDKAKTWRDLCVARAVVDAR